MKRSEKLAALALGCALIAQSVLSDESSLRVWPVDALVKVLRTDQPPTLSPSGVLVEAGAAGPEEVWRRQYGAGSDGPADKYDLAWNFLPKNQEEYRTRVAEHKKVLEAVPDNT